MCACLSLSIPAMSLSMPRFQRLLLINIFTMTVRFSHVDKATSRLPGTVRSKESIFNSTVPCGISTLMLKGVGMCRPIAISSELDNKVIALTHLA